MSRFRRTPRTCATLLAACIPVIAGSASTRARAATPLVTVDALRDVRITSQQARPIISVNTHEGEPHEIFNIPPLNGYRPQVVFGLTNQQADDDFSFEARASDFPGNVTLPVGQPPKYFIGTFDTGAAGHIISYDAIQQLDLFAAGREGAAEAELRGATGNSEFADISDTLGIYATGFANATGGAAAGVRPGSLKGQWNVSIMSSQAGSQLPNIIGAPMFAQYQVAMKASQPWELTVGGVTERSPSLTFQEPGTAMPGGYGRLDLTIQSFNGFTPTPTYFPSTTGIFEGPVENDPDVPTTWGLPFVNANDLLFRNTVNGELLERSDEFLFDTGAQVSVLSKLTASGLGITSDGEEPTPPDFTVQVLGVGGIIEVPGYYVDNLRLNTTGGFINFADVPVIVLDILDPRDGQGNVPGILGMNLFTERDLIMNGGAGEPAAYFGPRFRKWTGNTSGNWNDATKWTVGVPNAANIPVTFFDGITAPQTVNVNGNFTVGSISFDNEHSYTLSGTGKLTLSSVGQPAALFVGAGSHAIDADVHLASDTALIVANAASKLTISKDITANAGVAVNKAGPGTVEVKRLAGVGDLRVDAGAMKVLHGTGGAAGTGSVATLTIGADATLDLTNNNLVIRDGDIGEPSGGVYDGVQGDVQRAYNYGEWGMPGLTTSEPNAGPNAGPLSNTTTIAVATAERVLFIGPDETATFQGQPVTGASVIAMYTYAGDMNLDGAVDVADYGSIDNWIQFPGTTGYMNGDLNYDGIIDIADYGVIDNTIQLQGAPFAGVQFGSGDGIASVTAVPEPSACGFALLAAAAAATTARRRRRSRPRQDN